MYKKPVAKKLASQATQEGILVPTNTTTTSYRCSTYNQHKSVKFTWTEFLRRPAWAGAPPWQGLGMQPMGCQYAAWWTQKLVTREEAELSCFYHDLQVLCQASYCTSHFMDEQWCKTINCRLLNSYYLHQTLWYSDQYNEKSYKVHNATVILTRPI